MDALSKFAAAVARGDSTASSAATQYKKKTKDPRSHHTLRKIISRLAKETNQKQENDSALEGDMIYTHKGRTPITTLEQAIEFFNIDVSRYDIERVTFNSWDVSAHRDGEWTTNTNYQVKVVTKNKTAPFDYEQAKKDIDRFKLRKPKKVKRRPGSGVGVFAISDLHFGTEVNSKKGTIATKPYNTETLIDYLEQFVSYVNAQEYSEVHVAMLGDFIESFTGLNHISSWQGLESDVHYAASVIGIYEILSTTLSKIHNLRKTYMVAGNHDRVTSDRDQDVQGNVAYLLSYMLSKDFDVDYHPFILSKKIDGIGYIFTHNHHKVSKQSGSYLVLTYGFKDIYNVLMGGHYHSRNTKKEFFKTESHIADAAQYRIITVPPIFTGNFYSESIGFTSSAGFAHIEANKKKTNVTHTDVGL